MNGSGWALLGSVALMLGTLAGSYLLYRQQGRQTKTTDAQQIIDQLQENRKDDDDRHLRELNALRGEVSDLRARVDRMESRELVLLDYVAALRWHIEQRKPPPAPPWPTALMHRD